jgi:hypothetical protein
MIIAQHADKTWGELSKLIGFERKDKDRNLKVSESVITKYEGVFFDHPQSNEYLMFITNDRFYAWANCPDLVRKTVDFDVLLSIISLEDKV